MQNRQLDDIISAQSNNAKLSESLSLIKPRATLGSLAAYDNFEFDELYRFRQIYQLETDNTITGAEFFPGEMMSPKKINVGLPDDVYNILVAYYKNAYGMEFSTIAESVQRSSTRTIIVRPQVNQFGRIRIGAEIFGSASTPRYSKNSFILAKFVQENGSVELYPGQVQYFFEHEVNLPGRRESHELAFVKWFKPAPNYQTRFNFQIKDDPQSCIVEIWSREFYDIDRDSIIPVHNIFGRFIPSSYKIGRRNPVTYMAVIPIGRKFHMY
jgi:hypothetical protein